MKKTLTLLLTLLMLLSLALPCAAAEIAEPDWSGYNVSPVNPMNAPVPYGTEYPSAVHEPDNDGKYYFSGRASYSMLWLNRAIYGCSGYYVHIENHADTTLKCILRGTTLGDLPMTVPPHTDTTTQNGGRKIFVPAYNEKPFCITFDAPSNFSGYVDCACYHGG